jgi:SAM-dependent methyltransferase
MKRSRFATVEEIFSPEFSEINTRLLAINKLYSLLDHTALNSKRLNWGQRIPEAPSLYGSRMWEYPFAIQMADIQKGMTCADIGCRTTPFTVLLSELAGPGNVTGFDPYLISNENEDRKDVFGVKNSFIQKLGIKFLPDALDNLHVPDSSFDRVFCISVLEHIEDSQVWQKGICEMVRVLKPGGRLILTVDLGINCPLTNPLELIRYSGLVPMGLTDFSWPSERFLNVLGNSMDVFGLVLEKPVREIFGDYDKETRIAEWEANNKFRPSVETMSQKQIAIDYGRKYGTLRVLLKLLSGSYK